MNSKNPSILYIFGFGRSKLINSEKVYPNDFFYGYFSVKDKYSDTNLILHKLGKFYYLSATQLLYAYKYYANT